jgi:uncharacterized protein YqhQ
MNNTDNVILTAGAKTYRKSDSNTEVTVEKQLGKEREKKEEKKEEKKKIKDGEKNEEKKEGTDDGTSKGVIYTLASIVFAMSVFTLFYIFGFNTRSPVAFSRMIDVTTLCLLFVISTAEYFLADEDKKYELLENSVYNTEKLTSGPTAYLILRNH